MPACAGALGVKLVTFYPQHRGIPTHHATILPSSPETGESLGLAVEDVVTADLAYRKAVRQGQGRV